MNRIEAWLVMAVVGGAGWLGSVAGGIVRADAAWRSAEPLRSGLCGGTLRIGVDYGESKCVTPEPDCLEFPCRVVPGSNPPLCENLDDYVFAEHNLCSASPGYTCRLKDLVKCEDYKVCSQNPIFSCNFGGQWDCDYHHYNCTSTPTISYDDCETLP